MTLNNLHKFRSDPVTVLTVTVTVTVLSANICGTRAASSTPVSSLNRVTTLGSEKLLGAGLTWHFRPTRARPTFRTKEASGV